MSFQFINEGQIIKSGSMSKAASAVARKRAMAGQARVFAEAYMSTPQAETRGERRSSEKELFMDGKKVGVLPTGDRGVGTVVVNRLEILSTY